MLADKNQGYLQIDTIVFGGFSQPYLKYQKTNKFTIAYQYFKKKLSDTFDFFMKINIKLFLHVDSIKFGGHVQS